jgi:hypothetical protein
MKQYLLSVVTPSGGTPPPPEVLGPIMERVAAIDRELRDSGAWVFSGGLNGPDTATVLRPQGGEVLMTDGPFAEGKEYLGGFSIIRAADLDAALGWGRRLALAIGLPIEVRPFVDDASA